MKTFSLTDPSHHQRLEGGLVFVLSILLFWQAGGMWWLYLVLLFAPDLAMLGYRSNARTGAAVYNAFHNYLLPVALAVAGWLAAVDGLLWFGLVWCGHIGLDRALGYGLKLPTAFQDTHLGRIGRS